MTSPPNSLAADADPGRRGLLADLLGLILLLLLVYACAVRTFDVAAPPEEDAAILMRYVQHLGEGHGIVWNVGEGPVDGATDFLFLVLAAALHGAGLGVETAVRAVGGAAHVLTVLLVFLAARRLLGSSVPVAFVSAAFLALGPGLSYVAAGFGTPLFALFVCLAWSLANRLTLSGDSDGTGLAFALASLLMGLTRPEGVFLALFMLVALVRHLGLSGCRRTSRGFVLVFGTLGLAYFLWHWGYFGHPLPNPFYKKGGGLLYWFTLRKAFQNLAALGFPFLLAWPVAVALPRARRQAVFSLVPILGFTMLWVFLSDETNYLKRFRYPILPVILLSWTPLLEEARQTWRARFPLPRRATRLALATLGLAAGGLTLAGQYQTYTRVRHPRTGLRQVALLLAGYREKGYTLAVTEAGLLPFYSQWRAVDAWGLNDPWITHHGGVTEEYLDRYRPELILLHAYRSAAGVEDKTSEARGLGPSWSEMCRTLESYAHGHGYRLAAVFGRDEANTHVYYVRSGFEDSDAIVEAIRAADYRWYQDGKKSLNFASPSP